MNSKEMNRDLALGGLARMRELTGLVKTGIAGLVGDNQAHPLAVEWTTAMYALGKVERMLKGENDDGTDSGE